MRLLILLSVFITAALALALRPHQQLAFTKPLDDLFATDWHLFRHLGGYSPWIPHIHHKGSQDNTIKDGELPETCTVEQVHMLSRHAERFPTVSVGLKMKQLVRRMRDEAGPEIFPFLDRWELFFDVDEATGKSRQLEQLTVSGKYAGVDRARLAGEKLRGIYGHLIEQQDSNTSATSIFSCSCDRVVDTADQFATGFFGNDTSFNHVIVPDRDASRGGDTLTPVKACTRYREDALAGRPNSNTMADLYKLSYLTPTAERLRQIYKSFEFSVSELWTMQELCGFDILATGNEDSPWCALFTKREWEQFEYARDLLHYYRTGPGTPYSEVMGYIYLNATSQLLREGPEKVGKIFLSFAHDGDLVPLITTLGLFEQHTPLPTTHAVDDRAWRLSSVVPMGGRIVFERVSCTSSSSSSSSSEQTGVRLLVNDAVTTIPGCHSSTSGICPLSDFLALVEAKGAAVGKFEDVCGLGTGLGRRPSFLHHGGVLERE
ncbi:histidine phosphatase superfamily [Myxozyma melibiosi]|uniref:Histidine phosphatase superfamily n=1 Tax=Myxozyma melibiosi TaxID=54550 RepID=A0ABR1F935_9ASCO